MRLIGAVLVCWVASCQCWNANSQYGTALYLTVRLEGLDVDQLEVSVVGEGMALQRPEAPSSTPLTDPQTMRLLLRDELDMQNVTVVVDGLRNEQRVARGSASMTVTKGIEVDVTVTLSAVPIPDGGVDAGTDGGVDAGVDAGCAGYCQGCCQGEVCLPGDDAGSCGNGGRQCAACDLGDICQNGLCAGCNSAKCPNGCCVGSTCVPAPTAEQCGISGQMCFSCPGALANLCTNGTCKCGPNDQCSPGQRCHNNACVCDSTSCPDGCCDGNVCRRPPSFAACGIGGAACTACNMDFSDSCSSTGTCTCGSNPPCAPNQRCVSGQCVCTAQSCAGGCCQGTQCQGGTDPFVCGTGGTSCFACDPDRSNTCGASGCGCSGGPSCGAGQRCAGSCVCDGVSCPDGCCDATGACIKNGGNAQCGTGGAACASCGADTCLDGRCSSCSNANCPSGCCAGASCFAGGATSFTACGSGGNACRPCSTILSDNCAGGVCRCGNGNQCQAGQFCSDAGTCKCDPRSCNGCCMGDVCMPGTDAGTACGKDGVACRACAPPQANLCGLGECRCGNNPACGPGLRCNVDAGTCVCDSQSGCSGCCQGNRCVDAGSTTVTVCGQASGVCSACNTSKADNCRNGACACGDAGVCGTGLICQNGACVCNAQSGCGGCCRDNQCLLGNALNACGKGSIQCVDCAPEGNDCNNQGQCRCGLGAACPANQRCVALVIGLGCAN